MNRYVIATKAAKGSEKLITLGIVPSRPETGYGYIQYHSSPLKKVKKVKTFTEKPDKELAKELKKGTITQKTYDAAVKPVTMEQTIKANEGLQKYMYGKLFDFYNKSTDKINAINQIQFLLQAQTSVGGGFSRALATHTAFTLEQGKMYSEHQLQVMNFNGNFLMNMIKN
mgnify:CR=1 FL=1